MPVALPFVIRPAAGADVPVRSALSDLFAVAAELAEPVGAGDERAVRLWGPGADQPERAGCRAVRAAHAALVRPMPDDAPPY
ncbi:hypothetical protein [Actinacidiphila sp. bgisy160]|uniref:hypothetical protein n=1 Tax=Actinacidiphila sp. bgisy160 TaxID=3413796 RepID=UPI003D75299A